MAYSAYANPPATNSPDDQRTHARCSGGACTDPKSSESTFDADVGILLYESVRDPQRATNAAVMHPRAFRRFQSTRQQTWTLLVNRARANWIRSNTVAFSFETAIWGSDSHLAGGR